MSNLGSPIFQALTAAVFHQTQGYHEKFNSESVREARNRWHAAAIEVDYAARFAGPDSQQFLRAVEEEAAAHDAYCYAKDMLNILERAHGGRD